MSVADPPYKFFAQKQSLPALNLTALNLRVPTLTAGALLSRPFAEALGRSYP